MAKPVNLVTARTIASELEVKTTSELTKALWLEGFNVEKETNMVVFFRKGYEFFVANRRWEKNEPYFEVNESVRRYNK